MTSVSAAHSSTYRRDVDGLRAVAVLAVIVFHASRGRLPGGFVGVDVFFVISGFLITGIVCQALDTGTFTFRNFYARRIRRIFPTLILVLVATGLIGWVLLLPGEFLSLARHIAASALFSNNILLWTETGYFDVVAETKPLLHLWSLGVEEQFYLMWPGALVVAHRLHWNRKALILVIGGLSLAAYAITTPNHPSAAFYLPHTRLWELLAGAWLTTLPAAPRWLTDRSRWVLSLAGLLLIAWACIVPSIPGSRAVVAVAGAMACVAAGPGTLLNRRLLGHESMVTIGLASYALYLWHWPLLVFLGISGEPQQGIVFRFLKLSLLVAAGIAALLTYRYIERPIRRRSGLRVTGSLVGGMAAVCGVAWLLLPRVGPHTQPALDPFVWNDTLRWSQRCLQEDGFKERQLVYCARQGARPPRLFVLGDSHANAAWYGVSHLGLGGDAFMTGNPGCLMLPNAGGVPISERERVRCRATLDDAHRLLATDHSVVILANRWAAYVEGNHFGAEYEDGRYSNWFGRGVNSANALRSALATEVAHLVQTGHRVVVFHQVPELGFSPRRCLTMRTLLPPEACQVRRDLVEHRQARYRAAVDSALRGFTPDQVLALDPMDVLCTATYCSATRGDTVLYRDFNHLSFAGSEIVWRGLQSRLESFDRQSRVPLHDNVPAASRSPNAGR